MKRYYAGIGPREGVPEEVLRRMQDLGARYATDGLVLRSGAALGADTAFEKGCDSVGGDKQIFLPKRLHNGHPSPYWTAPPEAYQLIDRLWPDVRDRSSHVRDLFARNCQQVLGPNLDEYSEFVVCWTPGGKIQGGTGRTIRIAKHFNIHVVNLFDSRDTLDLFQYL